MRWTNDQLLNVDYNTTLELVKPGDTVDEGLARCYLDDGFTQMDFDTEENFFQKKKPREYIGSIGLHETFRRDSAFHPLQYCGLCREGNSVNQHPRRGRRLFIISAFHSEDEKEALFYRMLNRAIARLEYRAGNLPVMPHLYFPQFLFDEGFDRGYGIEAGHWLMEKCNAVRAYVVDGYVSEGMQADISYAASLGFKVEMHTLTLETAQTMAKAFAAAMTEGPEYEA